MKSIIKVTMISGVFKHLAHQFDKLKTLLEQFKQFTGCLPEGTPRMQLETKTKLYRLNLVQISHAFSNIWSLGNCFLRQDCVTKAHKAAKVLQDNRSNEKKKRQLKAETKENKG